MEGDGQKMSKRKKKSGKQFKASFLTPGSRAIKKRRHGVYPNTCALPGKEDRLPFPYKSKYFSNE